MRTFSMLVVAVFFGACGGRSTVDAGVVDAGPRLPLACHIAPNVEPNDDVNASRVEHLKLSDAPGSSLTSSGCLTSGDVDVSVVDATMIPRLLVLSVERTHYGEGTGSFTLMGGDAGLFVSADAGGASQTLWVFQSASARAAQPVVVAGGTGEGGYDVTVGAVPLTRVTAAGGTPADAVEWGADDLLRFRALEGTSTSGSLSGSCATDAGERWVKVTLGGGSHALSRLAQPAQLRYALVVTRDDVELARVTDRSSAEDGFELPDGGATVLVGFKPGAQPTCGVGGPPASVTSTVEAWVR